VPTTLRTGASTKETYAARRVVLSAGFLSQVHVDPDLAVETFILEPPSTDGAAAKTDA
jgi:hypothetical protein